MVLTASGLGMWLSALAVQYRDVPYGVQFLVQILMYAAPVIYPISWLPESYRLYLAIYPMYGVIEGFPICDFRSKSHALGFNWNWCYFFAHLYLFQVLIILKRKNKYLRMLHKYNERKNHYQLKI